METTCPVSAVSKLGEMRLNSWLWVARTVQVTTAIMQYGYRIVEDMASGLVTLFMEERGYNKLDEFIGCALTTSFRRKT